MARLTPQSANGGRTSSEGYQYTLPSRSATVTAATDVSLLSLYAADFQMLSSSSPDIAEVIRKTALERRGGTHT